MKIRRSLLWMAPVAAVLLWSAPTIGRAADAAEEARAQPTAARMMNPVVRYPAQIVVETGKGFLEIGMGFARGGKVYGLGFVEGLSEIAGGLFYGGGEVIRSPFQTSLHRITRDMGVGFRKMGTGTGTGFVTLGKTIYKGTASILVGTGRGVGRVVLGFVPGGPKVPYINDERPTESAASEAKKAE